MKTILSLLVICVLFPLYSSAQTKSTSLYTYNVSSFDQAKVEYRGPDRYFINDNDQYLALGMVLQRMNSKGFYWQFGLENWSMNKTVDIEYVWENNMNTPLRGGEWTNAFLKTRVEYGYMKQVGSFAIGGGVGLSPDYRFNSFDPAISNSFPVSENTIGLDLYLSPSIEYAFKPNWSVSATALFNASRASYSNVKVENPIFTAEQQTTGTFEFDMVSPIQGFRIGVGYHLN